MEQVPHPAILVEIVMNSAAERADLRVGDRLLAINGVTVRDVIDVQVLSAEPELSFMIERDGQRMACVVERRYGEPLGLRFAAEIFEGNVRSCRNNCDFCFVSQMAPGLRSPLYIKDDDYRLSFLHGNYVTLTNLNDSDWERIEEQFLSPLYVSVHATEPDVRVGLMHNPGADKILPQLERLADSGIEIHTQVVLVPERNDGTHLDRTIADLASFYPNVADVTVVPVGLTRWHNPQIRPYTDAEAVDVLKQMLEWQTHLRDELGLGFVYPSDEWYLRADVPAPPLATYDGLLPALVENGVGMVRLFLENEVDLFAHLAALGGPRQTWVTGTLFAPILQETAIRFMAQHSLKINVAAVPNHAFGETVTVAGLLTAEDIITTLRSSPSSDIIILSDEIFRGPDGLSLDNQSPTTIAKAVEGQVYVASSHDSGWQMHNVLIDQDLEFDKTKA